MSEGDTPVLSEAHTLYQWPHDVIQDAGEANHAVQFPHLDQQCPVQSFPFGQGAAAG